MARTWSNVKRLPSISPAQREKSGGLNSLTAFTYLLIFIAIWFLGLVAYTMVHVTLHPITELPQVHVQAPKED